MKEYVCVVVSMAGMMVILSNDDKLIMPGDGDGVGNVDDSGAL